MVLAHFHPAGPLALASQRAEAARAQQDELATAGGGCSAARGGNWPLAVAAARRRSLGERAAAPPEEDTRHLVGLQLTEGQELLSAHRRSARVGIEVADLLGPESPRQEH